jgi:hypothetical protein
MDFPTTKAELATWTEEENRQVDTATRAAHAAFIGLVRDMWTRPDIAAMSDDDASAAIVNELFARSEVTWSANGMGRYWRTDMQLTT